MRIRVAVADDAAGFVRLSEALDRESKFMLFEPGERSLDVDEQRARFQSMSRSRTQQVLVAELTGQLIGFLGVTSGAFVRNRRTASVVVGVLSAYQGLGAATRLFSALDAFLVAREIVRLELTVMRHNVRAIALYERLGFEREGVRRNALEVDGAWVDELYMARLRPA